MQDTVTNTTPPTQEQLFTQRHARGEDYATWLVKQRAAHLKRTLKLNDQDREDIEQTLLVDLLERWPRFDPARGSACTFISHVVQKKVAKLARKYLKRRDLPSSPMLDAWEEEYLTDEEACESFNGQLLEDDPTPKLDLKLDVEAAMEQMPPVLRETCEVLKHYNMAEAARQLGIQRWELMQRIAELREYLKGCV